MKFKHFGKETGAKMLETFRWYRKVLGLDKEKGQTMTDKEIIIEDVKLKAVTKSVKRYMKDGCNYSLYCDCNKCSNESWYDDSYCNNERLHFIDNDTKTIRVYCENYEVGNDR